MNNDIYPQEIKCYRCKWSSMVKTTEESYLVCINDNTKSSWPDYDNCKYYEEEENK